MVDGRSGSEDGFGTVEVARVLGLAPARVRELVRAGLVDPERGPGGALRFSFRDLVLLRTAAGLAARLPPRRVRQALLSLRAELEASALSGVQLTALGREVVARRGGSAWVPETGQGVFDFEAEAPATVAEASRAGLERHAAEAGPPPAPVSEAMSTAVPPGVGSGVDAAPPEGEAPTAVIRSLAAARLARRREADGEGDDAEAWLRRAEALEPEDPDAAMAAYREALARDPGLADAHLNLGRLLHEAGRLARAVDHYAAALERRADDPTALFNLGVVLEDLGDVEHAIEAYQRSVASDPGQSDAHYNLARLLEGRGDRAGALRHLAEYRRALRDAPP